MRVEVAGRVTSTLPADDDHPYRTGAWQPNFVEYDAYRPRRRGRDPGRPRRRLPAQHREPGAPVARPPVPPVRRRRHAAHDPVLQRRARSTATASCAPRVSPPKPRPAHALWGGILGGPDASLRDDGWGARTRMKDASSTDVVVHAGRALTSFYQCGDLYALRSRARSSSSAPRRGTAGSRATGASPRTPKVDDAHRRDARVQLREGSAVHALRRRRRATTTSCTGSTCRCPGRACRTTWRSPSTTRSSTTARCSGTRTARAGRARAALPSRSADAVRGASRAAATTADIRWFEADPTYVLHWVNAYEDGDEIVLDGFFQRDPAPKPTGDEPTATAVRSAASTPTACRRALQRWRIEPHDRATCKEDAVRRDHGVPDDQRALRGPAVPLHLQHDDASRAGSSSTAS